MLQTFLQEVQKIATKHSVQIKAHSFLTLPNWQLLLSRMPPLLTAPPYPGKDSDQQSVRSIEHFSSIFRFQLLFHY